MIKVLIVPLVALLLFWGVGLVVASMGPQLARDAYLQKIAAFVIFLIAIAIPVALL